MGTRRRLLENRAGKRKGLLESVYFSFKLSCCNRFESTSEGRPGPKTGLYQVVPIDETRGAQLFRIHFRELCLYVLVGIGVAVTGQAIQAMEFQMLVKMR